MTAAERLSLPQHPPSGAEHDPVCGMPVDATRTTHRAEHDGHSYFFCSARCRERFMTEPARYLPAADVAAPSARVPGAGEALWTCPMHPQIVRKERSEER